MIFKAFILVLSAAFFCSCGQSLSNKQELTVEMFGVFKEPSGVEGNASPKFYEIAFKTLVLKSSADDVELEAESAEALRIIDRPQIVYRTDIADYEDVEFTSAVITFDPDIVAGAKYESNYELTLDEPTITVPDNFTVATGKGLRFLVKVLWLNTVDRDEEAETETLIAPTFEITIEES